MSINKRMKLYFWSNLRKIWDQHRIVELKYGYIRLIVEEYQYLSLKDVQSFLASLDKAVKDRTVLSSFKNLIRLYPDNKSYREMLKDAEECLSKDKFFRYVKEPKYGMSDQEVIAIFYYDPATYWLDLNE